MLSIYIQKDYRVHVKSQYDDYYIFCDTEKEAKRIANELQDSDESKLTHCTVQKRTPRTIVRDYWENV